MLGEVSDVSGQILNYATTNPIHDGVVAAVDYVNDNGGIAGHKIQLVTCDGKGDPSRGPQCAQQMIQNNVVGVVGYDGAWGSAGLPDLEASGIPNFTDPQVDAEVNSKVAFPISGGSSNFLPAIAKYFAKDLGAKKVAYLYPDVPGAAEQQQQFANSLQQFGATDVSIQMKYPVADYTPAVVQAKNANPDAVYCVCQADAATKAAGQVGLKTKWIIPESLLTPEFVNAVGPLANNVYSVSPTVDYTDMSNPQVQIFTAAMKKYLPQKEIYTSTPLGFGYVMTLADIMKQIGPDKVNKDSLTAFMQNVHNFPVFLGNTLDVSSAPPGYPHVADPWYQIIQYSNGKVNWLGWQDGWSQQ